MAEFIGINENYSKLKYCNHAVMYRILYSMLIIYVTITNIHSQSIDSLKTAAIKQRIYELKASCNLELELSKECESYEKRRLKDSIRIFEYLSKYQKCDTNTLIQSNKCAKYLHAVAILSFDREKDYYFFKKYELHLKKLMFEKDSTTIIPSEPKFDCPNTFYYYNLLLEKFHEFDQLSGIYLELFRVAQMLQNDTLQSLYRNIIINKFPDDAMRWCMMPPVIPDGHGHCIQNCPELDLIRKAEHYLQDGYQRKAKRIYESFMEQCYTDNSIPPQLCIYAGEQLLKLKNSNKNCSR